METVSYMQWLCNGLSGGHNLLYSDLLRTILGFLFCWVKI